MHTLVKSLIVAVSPMLIGAGAALAAPVQGLHPHSPDSIPKNRSHLLQFHTSANGSLQAVSAADVGDADSFGRNVVYDGILGSEDVSLQEDCTGFPSGDPGNQCVVLNPQPAFTSFDLTDIGHVTLPANSTHSILCFHTTAFQSWYFRNETASAGESNLLIEESLTIENPLLDDPSLIDPTTGAPFNGKLTAYIGTETSDGGTLQAGEDRHHGGYVTRTCQAGAISTSYLTTVYGLPNSVVKNFFKQPITIRLNVNGNATLVQDAFLSMGVRFYGD